MIRERMVGWTLNKYTYDGEYILLLISNSSEFNGLRANTRLE